MKIRYELEKEIKGLEILHADETLLVKDVWQRGDEIRIFAVEGERGSATLILLRGLLDQRR